MFYRYPVQKIGITSDYGYRTDPYSGFHSGIDLGWMDYQGEPIYSIWEGVVIEKSYTSGVGYYIKIKHPNGDVSRCLHMKAPSHLNTGDNVSMGTHIGYMGSTGNSTGTHLHIDITRNGSTIDPKTVLYVYPDQFVSNNTKNNYKVLYYNPCPVSPATKDISKNQIQINTDQLNIRKGAGTTYETYSGYAIKGAFYNFYEVIENGGYKWYKIGDNSFIASKDNWVIVYEEKKEEEVDMEELNALKEQVTELEKENTLQKEVIEKLQKQAIENDTYKFKYVANENGKHKIALNKNEVLIIK